jgi:hypothetical protein
MACSTLPSGSIAGVMIGRVMPGPKTRWSVAARAHGGTHHIRPWHPICTSGQIRAVMHEPFEALSFPSMQIAHTKLDTTHTVEHTEKLP